MSNVDRFAGLHAVEKVEHNNMDIVDTQISAEKGCWCVTCEKSSNNDNINIRLFKNKDDAYRCFFEHYYKEAVQELNFLIEHPFSRLEYKMDPSSPEYKFLKEGYEDDLDKLDELMEDSVLNWETKCSKFHTCTDMEYSVPFVEIRYLIIE